MHKKASASPHIDRLPCSNIHAADVVQRVFTLLTRGGRKGLLADKVACAAVVLAAAIHDYGHLGVTNAFLIATEHPLAITYRCVSRLRALLVCSKVTDTPQLLPGVINRRSNTSTSRGDSRC